MIYAKKNKVTKAIQDLEKEIRKKDLWCLAAPQLQLRDSAETETFLSCHHDYHALKDVLLQLLFF